MYFFVNKKISRAFPCTSTFYFFSCNSWWSCGHKHVLTTRMNWKVKSMETIIWQIESEVISSFSNVWHTQHQKQDNRRKKRSPAPVLCLNPIEVYTCPWQNWQWMMRAQNCTNQIANVIIVRSISIFFRNINWGFYCLSAKHIWWFANQYKIWTQQSVGRTILITTCVSHMGLMWMSSGKGSLAKYNVHQHPAPATISHS